tara:strand:+ start:888 stop:2903 length:2016 start_codon:yes stop_codon:yes gene_type:complete
MGSGGGGTQYVESKNTTSNLPEYAEPYYTGMLQSAQGILNQDYVPYQGQRIADYTDAQLQTQQQVLNTQAPQQTAAGSDLAYQSGIQSLQSGYGYQPQQYSYQNIGQPNLNTYQMQGPQDVSSQQVGGVPQAGAQNVYGSNAYAQQLSGAPQVNSQQIGGLPQANSQQIYGLPQVQSRDIYGNLIQGPSDVNAQQIGAAQTDFGQNLNLQNEQMQDPGIWSSAVNDYYSSPYQQAVTQKAQDEAIRDAQKSQLTTNLGAASQGTLGGSRQLLAATERERNLNSQLQGIEVQGLQSAYENSQAQFERDRGAQMGADQWNAGARLGVQELGTNVGMQSALANLSSEQQARVQNQQADLQAQGMTADNALKAALANQSTTLSADSTSAQMNLQGQMANLDTATQTAIQNQMSDLQAQGMNMDQALQQAIQNQSSNLQAQGINVDSFLQQAIQNQQADLQAQQGNQQNYLQAQGMNQSAGLQAQGMNIDSYLQSAIANQASQLQAQGMNQEMAYQTAYQNLMSQQQTQQLGATLGLDALTANQRADLMAQQYTDQSNQYGIGAIQQGLSQANQSGQTLGNLGQAEMNNLMSLYGLQSAVGDSQQGLNQQYQDTAYNDFLRQRDYPLEQLSAYNSMLQGLPVAINSTQQTYAPPPSTFQQVSGLGLSALGLSKMIG